MSADLVSNEDMRRDMIPAPTATWDEIQRFALTFEGYDQLGSFAAVADVANGKSPTDLTEYRACLFFEQRRWRHFGEQPDAESLIYIRGLIEGIRERLP